MPKKTFPITSDAQAKAQGFANLLGMLSDPKRLRISQLLYNHPEGLSPSFFQQRLGVSQSLISHHLKLMRDTHVVQNTQEGISKRYTLTDSARIVLDAMVQDIDTLELTAEQRKGIAQALNEKSARPKDYNNGSTSHTQKVKSKKSKPVAVEGEEFEEHDPDLDDVDDVDVVPIKSPKMGRPRVIQPREIRPMPPGFKDVKTVLYVGAKKPGPEEEVQLRGTHALVIQHSATMPASVDADVVVIDERKCKKMDVAGVVETLKKDDRKRPVFVISDGDPDDFRKNSFNVFGADEVFGSHELGNIANHIATKIMLTQISYKPLEI